MKKLIIGSQSLGLELTAQQVQQFEIYLAALCKWSRAYNLTAITDPEAIIVKHFLDSLALAPYVQGEYLLDVGTGAGFPGLPLAIYYPKKQFVLLDSNAKKTRFLQHCQRELQLSNLSVAHNRLQTHQPAQPYTTIMTRAVGAIISLLPPMRKLCSNNGLCLFMCGQHPQQELQQLGQEILASTVVTELNVPYLSASRHLVTIKV